MLWRQKFRMMVSVNSVNPLLNACKAKNILMYLQVWIWKWQCIEILVLACLAARSPPLILWEEGSLECWIVVTISLPASSSPLLTPLLMSEHLRPDLILNLWCVVKIKKNQVCIINLKHGAKTFCCWTISASNNSLWRHSSESSITMKNCVEKYFLVSLDVKSYLWL